LSPGTAISISIRGARFTRSSIIKETLVNAYGRLLNEENRRSADSASHFSIRLEDPKGHPLGNQKDLVRIRILYFRSRRESFHVNVLARRIRTLHQVRLARNRNSVRIIALCNLRRRGWWRRWSCRGLYRWSTCGLNRAVRIKWLLRWRVLLGLSGRIIGGPMSGGRRWRLFAARSDKESRKQSKRQ
jgi:hypothetical protein